MLLALVMGMSMRIGWTDGVGVDCCVKGILQTPAGLGRVPCSCLVEPLPSERMSCVETLERTGKDEQELVDCFELWFLCAHVFCLWSSRGPPVSVHRFSSDMA